MSFCNLERVVDAVKNSSRSSNSDQGIHVWTSLKQGFKTNGIEFISNAYDRNHQQQFHQSIDQGILHGSDPGRERQTDDLDHGCHGNVEKRYGKHRRHDELRP